jgi:hypothetical protein
LFASNLSIDPSAALQSCQGFLRWLQSWSVRPLESLLHSPLHVLHEWRLSRTRIPVAARLPNEGPSAE